MKIRTEIYVGIVGSLILILICLGCSFYVMKVLEIFRTKPYTEEWIAEAEQKLLNVPDESKQQKYNEVVRCWTDDMRNHLDLLRDFPKILLVLLAFCSLVSVCTLEISLKFRKYFKTIELERIKK